jgi:pilus assembly protein Flp/PilA
MSGLQALCIRTGRQLRRFCASEDGATSIEYAVIAAGIGAAVIVTVNAIGTKLKSGFESVSNGF